MAKEMQEGKLNPNEGKLKALQAAMAKIEKDFGKGSIMKLGDEHVENIDDFIITWRETRTRPNAYGFTLVTTALHTGENPSSPK